MPSAASGRPASTATFQTAYSARFETARRVCGGIERDHAIGEPARGRNQREQRQQQTARIRAPVPTRRVATLRARIGRQGAADHWRAPPGASRATLAQSTGLSTLDERAKVRRAKQLAPRRADPSAVVVGLQQHRARRAQIGVERVVLGLLGLQFGGRGVADLLGLLLFRREFGEALGRGVEPRRQFGDDRLQLQRRADRSRRATARDRRP